MSEKHKRPAVGFSVIIPHPDGSRRMCVGKRKKPRGFGLWACPGGHLEFGETYEDAAAREVWEEAKLEIKVAPACPHTRVELFTSNWIEANDHVVTLWFVGRIVKGSRWCVPINTEPDKCEGWEWRTYEQLVQAAMADMKQHNWLPVMRLARCDHLIFLPKLSITDLSTDRHDHADEAWALYDFGDMLVKDVRQWNYVMTADAATWDRIFFTELQDGTTTEQQFHVRFGEHSPEVIEAYVSCGEKHDRSRLQGSGPEGKFAHQPPPADKRGPAPTTG